MFDEKLKKTYSSLFVVIFFINLYYFKNSSKTLPGSPYSLVKKLKKNLKDLYIMVYPFMKQDFYIKPFLDLFQIYFIIIYYQIH